MQWPLPGTAVGPRPPGLQGQEAWVLVCASLHSHPASSVDSKALCIVVSLNAQSKLSSILFYYHVGEETEAQSLGHLPVSHSS